MGNKFNKQIIEFSQNVVDKFSKNAKKPKFITDIANSIKTKKNKYAFLRKIEIIFGAPIKNSSFAFTSGGSDEYKEATDKIFGEVLKLGGYYKLPAPAEKEKEN